MIILYVLATVFISLTTLWSIGALFFDAGGLTRWGVLWSLGWVLLTLVIFFTLTPFLVALTVYALLFAILLGWWFSLRPSHNRDWDPNFEHLSQVTIDGDEVTITNVRHTLYRSLEDYDCRWETHKLKLSDLRAADVMILFWGSDAMCHPSLTFDFGNGNHICFSIEVRFRKNDPYHVLKGIYRQNELTYLVCDERDAILRRTKHSQGHAVYLYRLQRDQTTVQQLFEEYAEATNRIAQRPKWYNLLTSNCTTNIFWQRKGEVPWDWRMLFNGKLDELLYDWERLYQGHSFADLKKASLINDIANEADYENFGREVRAKLPGF